MTNDKIAEITLKQRGLKVVSRSTVQDDDSVLIVQYNDNKGGTWEVRSADSAMPVIEKLS